MSGDRYPTVAALMRAERQGRDFDILCRAGAIAVAIVAVHGGFIESGTSEIARAIAGDDLGLYCFDGLRPGRPHGDLHVTSVRFREPECLALIASCDRVVSVHGLKDRGEDIEVGGCDFALRNLVAARLVEAGFKAGIATDGRYAATDPANICNQGRSGAGVQLELGRALRDRLKDAHEHEALSAFVGAVRGALAGVGIAIS